MPCVLSPFSPLPFVVHICCWCLYYKVSSAYPRYLYVIWIHLLVIYWSYEAGYQLTRKWQCCKHLTNHKHGYLIYNHNIRKL